MADIPHVPGEVEKILAEDRFLRSLATSLLGSGPDADDAVQHAWLRSLECPPKREGALRAFLRVVLKNRIRASKRDDVRRAKHEQAAARPEAVPSAEEMASEEELRRRVGAAVLALDEPYRATVWLRFREELPPREVARRMSVPVETVRTRLRRALDELRRKLDLSYGDRGTWLHAVAATALRSGNAGKLLFGYWVMQKAHIAVAIALVALLTSTTLILTGNAGSNVAPDLDVIGDSSPVYTEAVARDADIPQGGSESEAAGRQDRVQREELEIQDTGSAEARDLYRIRVVHKETGEPIPRAGVSYYEDNPSEPMVPDPAVNHEVTAQERGETVFSDDRGIALVAVEQSVRITGRHEGLYGERVLAAIANRDPEQEHELALEPDLGVTVRVVDFLGEPAGGVRVGFLLPQEPNPPGFVRIGTTSEDGEFVSSHLQLWTGLLPEQTSGTLLLRPRIPGMTEGGVTVDLQDLPDDPVEIRLPPTGRVRVTLVDVHGAPLPQLPSSIRLAIPPDELPDGAWNPLWNAADNEGGTAIFEHVAVGRMYQARPLSSLLRAEGFLVGPRRHDEEVLFDLPMKTSYYGVAGRILGEDGNPLPEARVRARIDSDSYFLDTNADGSYWEFLSPAEREKPFSSLFFEVQRPSGSLLRSIPIQGGALMPGTNDFGDVVLSESRRLPIASGRLMVDGQPSGEWLQQRLRAESWDPEGERWLWDRNAGVTRGPGGSFEVTTPDLQRRYRLQYLVQPSDPYLAAPPLEFDAGAEELEAHLVTSGFLSAGVVTEDTLPLNNLWLRLLPLEGQFPEVDPYEGPGDTRPDTFLTNILYGEPGEPSNGQLPFRWEKLWPGRYLMQVLVRGGRGVLLTVPDVLIGKGPNEDPRLREIDLRGVLRQILVTVSNPSGELIPATVFLLAPGVDRQEGYDTHRESVAILLSAPYADLLVTSRSYRPKLLEAVSSDIRVTLQPNPEVLIRIAGGLPQLGLARDLEVTVESELPPDERRTMTDFGIDRVMDYYLRPPPSRTTRRFEGENEVVLQTIGAGTYRISLSVVNTLLGAAQRVRHPIPGFEPTRVELSGENRQILELRVPGDGLAEALERVR